MLRVFNGTRKRVDFGRHQGTRAHDGRKARDTDRGGLSAVGRTESVVNEDVAKRGVLLRERFVALLFARVAAAVLKHDDFARLHVEAAVHPVFDERHRTTEKFAHASRDVHEAVGLRHRAFGRATAVAHHHDGRTRIERHADRRNARHETGFVRDVAGLVVRRIEVAADHDALAG